MAERREKYARISPAPRLVDRLTPRSVRAKIVALLMVPVVSLMVLWGLATASAVQTAWNQRQVGEFDTHLTAPVAGLVSGLQAERAVVAAHLAGSGDLLLLEQRYAQTRAALTTLRDGVTLVAADLAGIAPDLKPPRRPRRRRDQAERRPGRGDRPPGRLARHLRRLLRRDRHRLRGRIRARRHPRHPVALAVAALGRVGEMLARQDAAARAAAAGRANAETHRAFVDASAGNASSPPGCCPTCRTPSGKPSATSPPATPTAPSPTCRTPCRPTQ